MRRVKRLTIIALLGLSPLIAEERFQLPNFGMTDNEKLYTDAVNAYNNREFHTAYSLFKRYENKQQLDKKGYFLFGRSAYEIGNYEEALTFYEKILLEEPNNLRVKLEIGQCYFKLEKYDEAKKEFDEVLKDNNVPLNVKQNILATVKAIEEKSSKHFFQATLALALIYDSNIDNSADAGDFSIYVDGIGNLNLSNSGNKRSDTAKQIVGILNHTYKLDLNKAIENKVILFSQGYNNHHDKNIEVLSLESAYSIYETDYKHSYALSYDQIKLGSESYLDSYSFYGRYDKKLTDIMNYQGYVKLNMKDYNQEKNKDLDSYTKEIYNSVNFKTEDFGINKLAITLGEDSKRRGIRTDVDKAYFDISLSNNYALPDNWIINSLISYKKSYYEEEDVDFLSKRVDENKEFSVDVLKLINKSLTAGTSYQKIYNDSNHSPFEYNKHVFKGFLYYNF